MWFKDGAFLSTHPHPHPTASIEAFMKSALLGEAGALSALGLRAGMRCADCLVRHTEAKETLIREDTNSRG